MSVLDASALLAFSRQEPGAQQVAAKLGLGHVSAANASEFVQKLNQYGDDGARALGLLESLGLNVHPVTRSDALLAASIYELTRPFGLSLGDRLCLALAKRLAAEVLTADAIWLKAAEPLDLKIVNLR